MTPTSPASAAFAIRRRGSQGQALLPRRRSRKRTPPWRRALWRRAGRSPSLGRSASVDRTEPGRAAGPRSRWSAGGDRVAARGKVIGARSRWSAGGDRVAARGRVAGLSPGWSGGDRAAPDRAVPAFSTGGSRSRRRGRGAAPGSAATRGRPAVPGLGAVRRQVAVRAARRGMDAAVPEVIDVLRATVAAGISPRRALQAAAEGAPPALEPVLRQAIQAAELGSGAGQALAAAAGADRLTELALAGEALDLAESTGAPPGPVLAGVAVAAADRVRTRQARMAATAQARLSARVVAAMAPAFLGVLSLTAPSEAAFLVREPLGWATLAAASIFELLGVAWSAQIVRGPAP